MKWGIPRTSIDSLRGGNAHDNAAHLREILAGRSGPMRDVVLLNAAAALIAFQGFGEKVESENIDERFMSALESVRVAIDSGAATALLDKWIERSHQV